MKERFEKNRSFTKPKEHLEKTYRNSDEADKIMKELIQEELLNNTKNTVKKSAKKKKKKKKN